MSLNRVHVKFGSLCYVLKGIMENIMEEKISNVKILNKNKGDKHYGGQNWIRINQREKEKKGKKLH